MVLPRTATIHQERQDFGAAVNASQWRYPMSEMWAALQRLATANSSDHPAFLFDSATRR